MRHSNLFIAASLTVVPALASTQEPNLDRPNILLLLADDVGYGELGCYGQQKIATPNLDSLAAAGMRFENFYAGNTVSSPSRACLLTGLHSGHVSVRGNSGYFGGGRWDRVALDKSEVTLGEMLRNAGYYTGMIGKWHLDVPCDKSTWAYYRGFDYAVQPQWSSPSCERKYDEAFETVNYDQKSVKYDYTKYDCLDSFRWQFAEEFLDKRRDPDKPFFLMMSYRIVHATEWQIRDKTAYANHNWPETERVHATKLTMLDTEVGRTLQKLKDMGELDNTIVIFMSDNGAHEEGGHKRDFFNSTAGLRGFKRDLYEGGLRVPAIFYWKGHIAAGTTSSHIAAFWDIMPTLAQLAGTPTPKTDGISIVSELTSSGKQAKHKSLYWEFQLDGQWHPQVKIDGGFRRALRMEQWKLVQYGGGTAELYNLQTDPYEQDNIAEKNMSIVKQMTKIMDKSHNDNKYFPYNGVLE